MISTVDPETRHTRKSKFNRKDGYRGHVAAEPETGLITDCEMTKAARQAGSDPVVGAQMISRDRYLQSGTPSPLATSAPMSPATSRARAWRSTATPPMAPEPLGPLTVPVDTTP